MLRAPQGRQPKGAVWNRATELRRCGGMEELREAAAMAAGALPEHFSAQERVQAPRFLVALGGNVAAASRGNGTAVAQFTQAVRHVSDVGPLEAALVKGSSPIVRARGPVPMSAASKGLGSFGKVRVAASLWRRVVPRSLFERCRKFKASARGKQFSRSLRAHAQSPGGNKAEALRAMLLAVRREGGLQRGRGPNSASAFIIPKNEVTCRLILNLVRLNREVELRPPRFRLP